MRIRILPAGSEAMRAQHQVIACRCHGVKGQLHGFTLLEMLLVMTLAALVLTVVPASFSAMLPHVERQAEVRELVAALRSTRGMAIRERQEVSFMLDLRRRQYHLMGSEKVTKMSDHFALRFHDTFSPMADELLVVIHFFADGSSSGGTIEVNAAEAGYQIQIDWLTGKVSYLEKV